MPLNDEAIHALGQMGYVLRTRELRRLDQMWDGKGESFFWSYLEREKQRRVLADQWYPVLANYAAECRHNSNRYNTAGYSRAEQEQLRVIREQMTAFVASSPDLEPLSNPQRVALVTTSPVGLPAAMAIFQPIGLRTVVLTDPEADTWFQINKDATNCDPWWFVQYRWALRDKFDEHDRKLLAKHKPPPPGSAYWMLTEGMTLNGLPCSAEHLLWSWDGDRASFVESLALERFF